MGDLRKNHDEVLAPAGTVLTTNGQTSDFDNPRGVGLDVLLNITAITGTTATITLFVEGKDPASGTYYTLLQGAGKTATGFTRIFLFPGAPVTANVSANDDLPQTWRVRWTITGTTPSVTCSIGASVRVGGAVA